MVEFRLCSAFNPLSTSSSALPAAALFIAVLPLNPLKAVKSNLTCTPLRGTIYLRERALDVYKVVLTKSARQDLLKVPSYIARNLLAWVDEVENMGIITARKVPGYHDEPLKGQRLGQRSIRLSKAYRAIYTLDKEVRLRLLQYLR